MDKRLSALTGIGLGAGLMYIFDPDRGKRRRSIIRDKTVHLSKKTQHAISITARDISNRIHGLGAEARSLLKREKEVPDDVLVERVRAGMGRYVSHPSAIDVKAENGHITLTGHILKREVDKLISVVSKVRGVVDVDNQLEVHETANDVPDLQGVVAHKGGLFELAQVNWSPTARFLVGASGGLLTYQGIRRGGILGGALGLLGAGMLARAVTNKRIIGAAAEREAVEVHKPVETRRESLVAGR